jgi:phenylalanyl-tRNA synthetase beta chain
MKIPLRWLADYVSVNLPADELVRRLTLAGLEVGCIRCFGVPVPEGIKTRIEESGPVWARDKYFTARVVKVEKHPNADKLKLPTVEYGEGRTTQLVTGAENLHVGESGQKVVVGLNGCIYVDTHVKPPKLTELKPKAMRGIESSGMVMSTAELGIADDSEGIILLDDDAPVGVPLADYMGDVVLDVDVLPNMARCLAMVGVAREVAALTGGTVKLPPSKPTESGKPIAGRVKVSIENPKLCARYAAALIEGVKLGPAPEWMSRRLAYSGMRSISNIVDVTNYVMLEWGQPLHAFDYDVLARRAGGKTPHIIVRSARTGEVLKTLDGVDRKLNPDMLVIADEAGAIALAGVMGGLETEVSDKTTNVLLESASFDFVSIRRTMRELDLISEASTRFSKGVHPEQVPIALGRASELMRLHSAGTVAQGVVDVYPEPVKPRIVVLKSTEVKRILGIELPLPECKRLLETLEYGVSIEADGLRVTTPPHRLDIQEGPADLIEDLARLYGYDRLPATMLRDQLPEQTGNENLVFEDRVKDLLVNLGLTEVITYSLTTPEVEAPLSPPEAEYVTIRNAISAERTVMRHSVLAGVLQVASANLKHTSDVHLFEVGSVYLGKKGAKLPSEPRRLAIVLVGRRHQEFWAETEKTPALLDFFDLKGVLESLFADLHASNLSFRPVKPAHLHPGKAAEVVLGESVMGTFGELHPAAAEALRKSADLKELEGRAVLVAELDLDTLRASLPPRHAYTPVSRFEAVLQDVAMIVNEAIPAAQVESEIWAAGGGLLRGVRLFDLYRGTGIAEGHKSLAYALTYQAIDRTLTDKEVAQAHKKIEGRLRESLNAQIRGRED